MLDRGKGRLGIGVLVMWWFVKGWRSGLGVWRREGGV